MLYYRRSILSEVVLVMAEAAGDDFLVSFSFYVKDCGGDPNSVIKLI
jgi:hypothetical protein